MMRFLFISSVFVALFCCIGCTPKPYKISFHEGDILLDGLDNDEIWSRCKQYSQFISPWDSLPDQGTQFRSFYDKDYLYFYFNVKDSNLICHEHENNDTAVEYSDRVELFFAQDSLMTGYCGLEFDACGRRQQFYATGYRRFKKGWSFPGLMNDDYASKLTEVGYKVEGRLSMISLQEMGFIDNGFIHLGVFRADCQSEENQKEIRWISWKDINTRKADFHTYGGFQKVQLAPPYSKAQIIKATTNK